MGVFIMSGNSRGSRLVTLIIIVIFLLAGVFYVKTSHPGLVSAIKRYFKKDNSLAAATQTVYDSVVLPGESGGIVTEFDYLLSYNTQKTVIPLKNATVTSHFGSRRDPVTGQTCATHHGIDLAAKQGSKILCYKDGTVVGAEYGDAVYGNCVTVSHGDEQTFYAHMSDILVKAGDTLEAGDVIGIIGSTGKSTGIHLHFELTKNGVHVDPYGYLYEKV